MSDEQDKLKVSLEPPKLFGRKKKSDKAKASTKGTEPSPTPARPADEAAAKEDEAAGKEAVEEAAADDPGEPAEAPAEPAAEVTPEPVDTDDERTSDPADTDDEPTATSAAADDTAADAEIDDGAATSEESIGEDQVAAVDDASATPGDASEDDVATDEASEPTELPAAIELIDLDDTDGDTDEPAVIPAPVDADAPVTEEPVADEPDAPEEPEELDEVPEPTAPAAAAGVGLASRLGDKVRSRFGPKDEQSEELTESEAEAEDAEITSGAYTAPMLDHYPAAILTGAVVGLGMVVLTWLSLRGCEAIRGTATCGGGPGFLLLVATFVVSVLLGSAILKSFKVPDPGSSSFLAVGLIAVISLLLLVDYLDHWVMLILIPLISVGAFALSVYITKTFVEPTE